MFFFGGKTFSPATDISDLSGKVILVTGGNNGLGKESILQLAKHKPAKIYMGARTESKAAAAIADIKKDVPDANIIFLDLDLSSFASIKDAANKFLAENDRLDILMNNAGVMALPQGLTKEGYEIQFGTNHMGHALLTKILLPLLEKTAKEPGSDVRIVNLSSMAHTFAPPSGIEFEDAKTDMAKYRTWARYGQSKLANVLFTKGLAKRYPDIKSVAVHPGAVNTGLINSFAVNLGLLGRILKPITALFMNTVEKGALGQLWASTAKDEGKGPTTGHFYYPVAVDFKGSDIVNSEDLADALWNWTEKEFESKGY